MQGVKQLPAVRTRQKKPTAGYRLRNFRENFPYLTMILPAVLVVFLFNYLPIYGVLIAFQVIPCKGLPHTSGTSNASSRYGPPGP